METHGFVPETSKRCSSLSSKLKVDRSLLPVKCAYFSTLAAVASMFPYLGVFMKQLGMSPTETAIVYGTMPFVAAVVRAMLGGITDKFRCPKYTLAICCLLSAALHLCLLLVPQSLSSAQKQFGATLICDQNGWHLASESEHAGTQINDETDAGKCPYTVHTSIFCLAHCNRDSLFNNTKCLSREHQSNYPTFGGDNFVVNFTLLADEIETVHETAQHSTCAASKIHWHNTSCDKTACTKPSMTRCNLTCQANASSLDSETHRFGRTFWTFLCIFLPAQIAFAPIFSLLDAVTYAMLGDRRNIWGRQRLWGSVGYGTCAILSGFLIDAVSRNNADGNYMPAILLFFILQTATAVIIGFYPRQQTNPQNDDINPGSARLKILHATLQLLRIPNFFYLLVLVFACGAYTGHIETFLFWYIQTLKPDHPPPRLLFGLSVASNCVPEIIILFASPWIIERFGHVRCLYAACASYSIRFVYYALIYEPWLVLVAEPLHSISFGLMYASASAYGSEITPPGMHGTVQGIIGSLYFGFGKGSGSLLGGHLYETYGGRESFLYYGISAAILLVVYIIVTKAGRKKKK